MGGRELSVVPGPPDSRILAVAAEQHSRIDLEQLVALGITPAMIRSRLRSGVLDPLHRGVYRVGPRVAVELGDETAALLAVGDPVALSHESAARLWQIWPGQPDAVHLTVPGNRAKSRRGTVVHRSSRLTKADLTIHRGLPVTTPARALLDLAEHHPSRAVERAVDEALARRIVSPTKIREVLVRSPGRTGAPLLAALIDPQRAGGVTVEHAEERLLALFRHANLPDPQRNARLGAYTVDFLWPQHRIAVEFDSFAWHASRWSFRRDRAKDAHLKDRGIDLHRVTWAMLEDPIPLIARLTRAITLAA